MSRLNGDRCAIDGQSSGSVRAIGGTDEVVKHAKQRVHVSPIRSTYASTVTQI